MKLYITLTNVFVSLFSSFEVHVYFICFISSLLYIELRRREALRTGYFATRLFDHVTDANCKTARSIEIINTKFIFYISSNITRLNCTIYKLIYVFNIIVGNTSGHRDSTGYTYCHVSLSQKKKELRFLCRVVAVSIFD